MWADQIQPSWRVGEFRLLPHRAARAIHSRSIRFTNSLAASSPRARPQWTFSEIIAEVAGAVDSLGYVRRCIALFAFIGAKPDVAFPERRYLTPAAPFPK